MDEIHVTKTFLPPYEEYEKFLRQIWESHHLTNNGPLLKRFEHEVKSILDLPQFQFVANGTLGLQITLDALNIHNGEVITTPFSYVATTSSILWQRCTPVFVDIDPETLTIDVSKIEASITERTRAIMAVHVYGNPCDVEGIQKIADKHKLKVVYDAAHAFMVNYKGSSLLTRGDASVVSFHATKLFHTIEGGGIVMKSEEDAKRLDLIKRFGHHGDNHLMLGTNAKANEFQAAMGLANLPYARKNITERKRLSEKYDQLLDGKVQGIRWRDGTERNYIYYPVIFESETELLATMERLSTQRIYPRRYFFPSLNTLSYLKTTQVCPISEDVSRQVLCLPLYPGLEDETIERVCKEIK